MDKGYPKLVIEYCIKAELDGLLLGTRTQKCLMSAYLRLELFQEALQVLDVITTEEMKVRNGTLMVIQPFQDVRDALRLKPPADSVNLNDKLKSNNINVKTIENKNNKIVNDKNINNDKSIIYSDRTDSINSSYNQMKNVINKKNSYDINTENINDDDDNNDLNDNKIKFLIPSNYRDQNMARFNDPNLKEKDKEKEKEELFFGLDLFCFVILMTSPYLRKNISNHRFLNSTPVRTCTVRT